MCFAVFCGHLICNCNVGHLVGGIIILELSTGAGGLLVIVGEWERRQNETEILFFWCFSLGGG